MTMKFYSEKHLNEVKEIIDLINIDLIEDLAVALSTVKLSNGRIFFLGVVGNQNLYPLPESRPVRTSKISERGALDTNCKESN